MKSIPEQFQEVRNCAREYSYQLAWTQHEKRENICLAVSRMFLEIALCEYRMAQKGVYR